LCGFVQCSEHGFPQKPSAVAYDSLLSLLAVGTENGDVRMYAVLFLLCRYQYHRYHTHVVHLLQYEHLCIS